jgi:hypothetical protein
LPAATCAFGRVGPPGAAKNHEIRRGAVKAGIRSLAVRNAAFTVKTPAHSEATFNSWNEQVFGVSDAMNADLMITIAFCLYVLVGSLAVGVLAAKSIRDDNAKEADAKRRAPVGEPADGSRRPLSTRLQAELPTGVSEQEAEPRNSLRRATPAVWLGPERSRK